MSNNNYPLRPEAAPVPYGKLQWRAKDGLELIINALKAAVSNARKEPAPDEIRSIDKNRTNQIFFVSGEPGSGKSTLYLTLRAMLTPEYKVEYRKDYTGTGLDDLETAVRWLDPIDLEVAGDEGENLLAAVLVRLSRELEEKQSGFSNACVEAIKELSELAADIGMAWEGNLQSRGGALDPDTYSMEVMRAQRARLGVNQRLRKALNRLAKEQCYGCNESTLFVLPVDDFYLKPDASLQLLRLLRMISVPRLFFLVMGDITTIEALFVEKALADWTAVAGPEVFAALPDRQQDVLSWARELRARFLRKLLPPSQHATVEPMDWFEAMVFKPHRSDDVSEKDLRDLLATVDFDPKWTPDIETSSRQQDNPKGELLHFLTCRSVDKSSSDLKNNAGTERGKEKEAREAYTGLQILDATPRETMDFWIALHEHIRSNPNNGSQKSNQKENEPKRPQLLSLIVKFVKLAMEEQNFLDEAQQKQLSGVLPTRHYYATDTYLEMDRLFLKAESSWKDKDKISRQPEVWMRKHSPWRLSVGDAEMGSLNSEIESASRANENSIQSNSEQKEIKSDPFAKLPPRLTAWIILLHDLAWKWRQESISSNLVKLLRASLESGLEIGQKSPAVSPPDSGWAFWRNTNKWEHFPLPNLETFHELDRFLRIWNTGLDWFRFRAKEEQETDTQNLAILVNLWELASMTVIDDKYDAFAKREKEWFENQLNDFSISTTEPIHSSDNEKWKSKMMTLRQDLGISSKEPTKTAPEVRRQQAAPSKMNRKRTPKKSLR